MRDKSTCQRCGIGFEHQRNTRRFYCSNRCRHAEPPLTLEERYWPKLSKAGPVPDQHPEFGNCWDWTGARTRRQNGQISYGYLKIRRAPVLLAHHLAWTLAGGSPVPENWEIGHTCDRVQCCRNDEAGVYVVRGVEYERHGHLWLATHAANMADCADKQRAALRVHPEMARRGEHSPVAKLSDAAVMDICCRYATGGVSQQELADEYRVSTSTISMIVNGIHWGHLNNPLAVRKKRQYFRSEDRGRILTPALADAIRDACDQRTSTQAAIAQQYGVSLSTVAKIAQRKLWRP